MCSRRELGSLVGLLNHTCKVVRPGRTFLRRMFDLLHAVPMHRHRPHPIRLNRSDLAWWRTFVVEWNGVSLLTPPRQRPTTEMASDTSGSWGCGAWHDSRWFQIKWDAASQELPIMVKEMLPIVLACERWGPLWQNQWVICHCDNQAVVASIRSRTSKNSHCMHLLRALTFIKARHRFVLQVENNINTKLNHLVDDLSHDNLSSFVSKVPEAAKAPDLPSPSLLSLLLDPHIDWVSQNWRRQFADIFRKVLPPPQDGPTTRQ